MKDVKILRDEIDLVDKKLVELFEERLKISKQIGEYKIANDLPVYDAEREQEKLDMISLQADEAMRPYAVRLYKNLAEISKSYQYAIRDEVDENYALIGGSVKHSLSSKLHALIGDYNYDLLEAKNEEELAEYLKDASYSGFNITHPYKETVIKYLDDISDEAKSINAVNTVKRMSDGRLVGYNTDVYGFRFLVNRDITGWKAMVFGTGGGARAAVHGLKSLGADPIYVVTRDVNAAIDKLGCNYNIIGYNDLREHKDARLVVNATPVGMYPENGSSPLDGKLINTRLMKNLEIAIDLIYNPYRTKFLQDAERCGGKENKLVFGKFLRHSRVYTISGLDMLIRQALFSKSIWLDISDHSDDEKLVREVKRVLLSEQLNIITIGMPGSGKSSVSRMLARIMERPFIDIDKETEKLMGMSVSEALSEGGIGEEAFRNYETQALTNACKLSGCVIASGGGSVLRPRNRDIIKENAIVVFIKRPTSSLSQKNRPLSQRDGIEKLYKERYSIYRKMSDVTVSNISTFGETRNKYGEKNSYIYDIRCFAYRIQRKTQTFLDDMLEAEIAICESAK